MDNLLSESQFGFRRQRSTKDALLVLTNTIYRDFEAQRSTVVVFLDFDSAFDKTPHSTILLQSMKLGIRGKMLRFINSFLEKRQIRTSVNGVMSGSATVESGIVQLSLIHI